MKAVINNKTIELQKQDGKWILVGQGDYLIQKIAPNKLLILVNGETFTTTLLSENRDEKTVEILLNGKKTTVKIKEPLDDLLHDMGLDTLAQKGVANIKAPMPGLVLDISVSEGAAVKKGDKILVLEAMKMENAIKSSGDGIVARVLVSKGQTVEKNQVLVEFA
jgi:biotin carboxyl carrier protein